MKKCDWCGLAFTQGETEARNWQANDTHSSPAAVVHNHADVCILRLRDELARVTAEREKYAALAYQHGRAMALVATVAALDCPVRNVIGAPCSCVSCRSLAFIKETKQSGPNDPQ